MTASHSKDFMTRKILFALVSVILFTAVDCKDEPTKPPVTEQPQDTTSHNYVVTRVDTLGDLFSEALGVDIVDENNIWVVGLFTKGIDSINSHSDSNYNAVHWDGSKWNMLRIPMYGWNNTGPSPEELGGIKVFSDSSVFVVAKNDNSVAWWNGRKWTSTYVNDAVVSPHFWARSFNDIYFVSNEGRATHFNGQTFTKMTTGITNPPLTDIWGDDDEVFATGHSIFMPEGTEHVLLYSNNITSWQIVQKYTPTFENRGSMLSIFKADNGSRLWMLGGKNSGSVWEITSLFPFEAKEVFNINNITLYFVPYLIRGNADNDLIVVGAVNGELFHFNGKTWKMLETPLSNFSTQGFDLKNNIYVIAGYTFDRAVVAVGRRN